MPGAPNGPGLRRQGYRSRRLGPQGTRHGRDRDAGPDGDPQGIRPQEAAEGRAHRGLAAHDHPDRRADRDAEGAGRRRALGLVQHLLDPGPCRRGDRQGRHAGLRHQGREPRGVLGLHPQDLRMGRRRRAQHDPRRRRRRHAAGPSRRPRGEGSVADRQADQRGGRSPLQGDRQDQQGQARLVRQARRLDQGRHRGDDHGRAPPLQHGQGRQAPVAGHQRQRLGHQVEVRQPLRLPRIAGRRHPPRHRRHDVGQGGDGRGLRRRRQGLGRLAAPGRLPRHGLRGRSDLRAAGGDGRL